MEEQKPACFGEWTESDKCKQCPSQTQCKDVTQVFEEEEKEEEEEQEEKE